MLDSATTSESAVELPRSPGAVQQIDLPANVRGLSALPHLDYSDAFLLDVSASPDRTPEQWARRMIEGAPRADRLALLAGWSSLGLKVNPMRSEPSVFGWELLHSGPAHARLGLDSRLGMPAELLFVRREQNLLFATLVRQKNPLARLLWSGIEARHQTVVASLLARAGRS